MVKKKKTSEKKIVQTAFNTSVSFLLSLEWPKYTATQKRNLISGLKPKVQINIQRFLDKRFRTYLIEVSSFTYSRSAQSTVRKVT